MSERLAHRPPTGGQHPVAVACRPVGVEEIPAVAAFAQRVFDAHVAPGLAREGAATFAAYASANAIAARRDDHRLVVAEAGATLVGMLEVRGASHVSMLFVDGAWQRRGIGRALLRAAFGAEAEWPALTVNSAPEAAGAYARMGFVATAPEEERGGLRYLPMRRARPAAGRT